MPAGVIEVPTRDELRAHLLATQIAGWVHTPRQSNVKHYKRLAQRDPYYLLGLTPARDWSFAEVLALMSERVGVDPTPEHVMGADTIDPDLTIAALDAMAERIAAAAERRDRVLLATGHPGGLLGVYAGLAGALAARGCTLLRPKPDEWRYRVPPYAEEHAEPDGARVRYSDGVAMLATGRRTHHTHAPEPMEALLAELAERGAQPPDFVLADHGWAGAAAQAGIATVGFADCNDPALFVAEAEGTLSACVPLDDHVAPKHYAPLTSYLLDRCGG